MDFVVAGIVIGGLLVACGVVVRDFGPRLLSGVLRKPVAEGVSWNEDGPWRRYCVAVGSLITAGGMLVVLVTILGIITGVSDSVGNRIVLIASGVAVGCLVLAAFVVTPHYRRGGYAARAEPEPVFGSAVAKSAPFRSVPVDDLFSADIPAEESAAVRVAPQVIEPALFAEKVSEHDIDGETGAPPTIEVEHSEPVPVPLTVETPDATLTELPIDEPEPVTSVTSREDEQREVPAPEPWVPVAASRRVYEHAANGRSETVPAPVPIPVALDTGDEDELPAWNAPVPEPEPVVPPPPKSVPIKPTAPAEPGGFQSSLLADLTESPDEPADLTGTFKSRLLNELTRTQSHSPEPTVDVLLDEFSVPPQQPGENRGSGNPR